MPDSGDLIPFNHGFIELPKNQDYEPTIEEMDAAFLIFNSDHDSAGLISQDAPPIQTGSQKVAKSLISDSEVVDAQRFTEIHTIGGGVDIIQIVTPGDPRSETLIFEKDGNQFLFCEKDNMLDRFRFVWNPNPELSKENYARILCEAGLNYIRAETAEIDQAACQEAEKLYWQAKKLEDEIESEYRREFRHTDEFQEKYISTWGKIDLLREQAGTFMADRNAVRVWRSCPHIYLAWEEDDKEAEEWFSVFDSQKVIDHPHFKDFVRLGFCMIDGAFQLGDLGRSWDIENGLIYYWTYSWNPKYETSLDLVLKTNAVNLSLNANELARLIGQRIGNTLAIEGC